MCEEDNCTKVLQNVKKLSEDGFKLQISRCEECRASSAASAHNKVKKKSYIIIINAYADKHWDIHKYKKRSLFECFFLKIYENPKKGKLLCQKINIS